MVQVRARVRDVLLLRSTVHLLESFLGHGEAFREPKPSTICFADQVVAAEASSENAIMMMARNDTAVL